MLNLSAQAQCSGPLPETVGHPWSYFERRGCVLDCRGPLVIDPTSHWGFGVRVITRSPATDAWPVLGHTIDRGVTVEMGAWIGSYSVLTGCRIGRFSIVAAGTVVRGQDVGPGVMVAGNPARVIARWDGAQWVYEPAEVSGFGRVLA
jgi:acetyltransferase-like isoleucine patch superfamily enzyme